MPSKTYSQTMAFAKKCEKYGYYPSSIISKAILKTEIVYQNDFDNTVYPVRRSKTRRGAS